MMTNSPEIKTNTKLSIQVRLDGLSFFTQNINNQQIDEYTSLSFEKIVDPEELLKELHTIFEKQPLLKESYKTVDVIYINSLFTLVPKAIFEEDKLTDYLKFNTKILSTDYVAYDTLENHDIMSVYIPYTNINNFFFDTYGAFDYHHGISLFVNYLLDNEPQQEEPKVVINLHPSSFEVAVIQKKKLLLANSFDFRSKEDFIYYVLFTLEQLELNPETVQVELTGHISQEDENFAIAYQYIRNVVIRESTSAQIDRKDYILSTLV